MSAVRTHVAIPTSLESIALVGRGVMIETIRRKEFYVLLIFMAIYMVGVLIAGLVGVENEQTLVFLLNLGISFAYLAAHVMALLTASRQIPFEIDNRTIHPLLAKPLSRQNYLLGKWAATTASSLVVFLVLFVMSYIPWLFFPGTPTLSVGTLAQAMALNSVSLGLVASLALLGSLLLPQGVNMALCGLLFFVGSTAINLVKARAVVAGWGTPVGWLSAYIPDFNNLNLFTRYTDGIGPVGAGEFMGLIAYGIIFTAAAWALAAVTFDRRPL